MGFEDKDSEYEIHPLDRDYSQPIEKPIRRRGSADGVMIRLGAFGFGAGFLVLLLAAVAISNSSPGGTVETIVSYLHRIGMLIMLMAGTVVILAFRAPNFRSSVMTGNYSFFTKPMTLGRLMLLNLIGFVLFSTLVLLSFQLGNLMLTDVLCVVLFSIAASVMVTIAIWHRGLVRAFAIGAITSVLCNGMFGLTAVMSGYFRSRGFNGVLLNLAVMQISGLVCAFYVSRLEKTKNVDNESSSHA